MGLNCAVCNAGEKLKRVFFTKLGVERYEQHYVCATCLQANNRYVQNCYLINIPLPSTEKERNDFKTGKVTREAVIGKLE